MPNFQPGLVHTPLTPFTSDHQIDFGLYKKLIEFHLDNGADSLALPMHAGESVSLTDKERRDLLRFSLKQVNGRVPVIAHVSQSGTALAAELARDAETAGADAIVATTPYYWTPQPAMMLEHFAQIGSAVRIPFYVHNAPDEMGGTKITTDLVIKLAASVENFLGVVDSSLDWQFLIELASSLRRIHPNFQLLSGAEYLVSAGAIGATGVFAPMAAIAPSTVRRLYDLCRDERYNDARKPQEELSALRQVLKIGGIAGLKGAMRLMDRDCGEPRSPVLALDRIQYDALAERIDKIESMRSERRGW
jgi:4-hydroxy-tetrahydrodipicolinate synthase